MFVAVDPRRHLGVLSERVIGCAIEVHRHLGPGLLESVYRRCLARELRANDIAAEQEVAIPVTYKGEILDFGFRADLMIEEKMLAEIKVVDRISPVHEAQLLTYLKLSGLRVGLLLNFNAVPLRSGIRRLVR